MIEKFKTNFAESIALKKFTKTQNFGNSYKEFLTEAIDTLVILPEKIDDIHTSLKVIKYLINEGKKVYLYFNIDSANYIPSDIKYISVTYKKEDKTKFGLPSKDHLSKIEIIFFDLVIDLNIGEDIYSSVIANVPRSNFRIGFTKKNSDNFYNFQVKGEINSEKSYRNLLNSLRMF